MMLQANFLVPEPTFLYLFLFFYFFLFIDSLIFFILSRNILSLLCVSTVRNWDKKINTLKTLLPNQKDQH
jgi:hypothetical protein